jgi:transcriptional regulator with GAF, ATPase, and Fis domain
MSRRITLAQLRERHRREERRLVLGALDRNAWGIASAAAQLDVHVTQLQRMIDFHGLRELYDEHSPGRGRPKKPVKTSTNKATK